jgi:hypothetical protein
LGFRICDMCAGEDKRRQEAGTSPEHTLRKKLACSFVLCCSIVKTQYLHADFSVFLQYRLDSRINNVGE